MVGRVVVEMRKRLKWVKAVVGEVVQYGRNYCSRLDIMGCKGSAESMSTRKGRRTAEVDGGYKHFNDRGALKATVASLVDRVHQGTATKSYYVNVLQKCFQQKDFEAVKQVHECIQKSRLEQNPYLVNNLLKCYIGCGRVQNALELFNSLLNKNIVSWTIMIGGYADNDQTDDAFETYRLLRENGGQPNAITYLNILKACASPSCLSRGKDIHAHISRDGLQADVRVSNALVSMYARCDSIEDAKAVFDSMNGRNVISYNAMIGGLARHGFWHEAFSLFLQMQREGFTPDSITILSILNASSSQGALEWVKEVHNHARQARLDLDLRVGNALIHMYAKIGSMNDARQVFDKMLDRNVVTWSTMIGGMAQQGLGLEAFSLFLQMKREGFTPNPITYLSILNPCSSKGALEWVKQVHDHAKETGLDVDLLVGNALVHMYAKVGSIADARQVFDKMLDRDIVTWTAMIGGLAQHGHGRVGQQLFEEMESRGGKPNGPLFLAVLSACSHAGLVDDGRFQFASMTRDYCIKPALEHYGCVVDMLGRGGHLEEAKLFIQNMPINPDVVTWKALLGACRIYSNSKLAERAARECLKMEPMDSSAYVLLSNIYAGVGRWDQVSRIRYAMTKRGICKMPGRCWIEVNDKMHEFVAGDASHPEAEEIHAMLSSLFLKLKAEGYTPDTRLVLRNIDEEEKENAVCFHSEKLAIAYGLMHVTHDKPIRVYNDLRICTDCHTAAKLISKITEREIVARDANRFHHFKEGLCSCYDYW